MKKYLLLIVVVTIFFDLTRSQEIFGKKNEIASYYSSVCGVASIDIKDIDGDGDFDLLSASYFDRKVAWYENINGEGLFGTQKIVVVDSSGVYLMQGEDMDSDGDIDIVFASIQGQVAWYKNEEAVFDIRNTIYTGLADIDMLFVVDVDGDNDMDVITAQRKMSEYKIVWCENINGYGLDWSIHSISDTSLIPFAELAVGDIDSDGDIDILVSGQGVYWYENIQGNNVFSTPKVISEIPISGKLFSVDIDGDGDMDVLAQSYSFAGQVFWFENIDGYGDFGEGQLITSFEGEMEVATYDIDGDNDIDITLNYYNSDENKTMIWMENLDGNGMFGSEQDLFERGIYHYPFVKFADIDQDDDVDVITSALHRISWYENVNNEIEWKQHIANSFSCGTSSISSADLDSDGDLDIITTSSFDGTVLWHENTDDSIAQIIHPIDVDAKGTSQAVIADFNGDGNPDIFAVDYFNDELYWNKNVDGLGEFEKIPINNVEVGGIYTVSINDFDNDNDIDILLGLNSGDSPIYWLENVDGLGNFELIHEIPFPDGQVHKVCSNDLDADFDMDILVFSTKQLGTISCFENVNSLGEFICKQELSDSLFSIERVYFEDVDSDDDIDVLAYVLHLDSWEYELIWYENQEGIFDNSYNSLFMFSDSELIDLCMVDIDLDGNRDILFTDNSDDALQWCQGIGTGDFLETMDLISVENPKLIYYTDIDGDTDMDLIIGSDEGSKVISWYENLSITSILERKSETLSLFPNPTKLAIYIAIPPHFTNGQIEVFDLSGRLVINKTQISMKNNQLKVDDLPSGIYTLRLIGEQGIYVGKFVKE